MTSFANTFNYSNAQCAVHPGRPATEKCACCGKDLCADCATNNRIPSGQYANRPLCPDCAKEQLQQDIKAVKKNVRGLKVQFILMAIGAVIGGIAGFLAVEGAGIGSQIIYALIGAGIGGVFLSAFRAYVSILWESIKMGFVHGPVLGIIFSFIAFFVAAFKCLWVTGKSLITAIPYLSRARKMIAADQEAIAKIESAAAVTAAAA